MLPTSTFIGNCVRLSTNLIILVFLAYLVQNGYLDGAQAQNIQIGNGIANCNPAITRVTTGLLAYYPLNDSSNNPQTITSFNTISTFGSLPNLVLTSSSAWCTLSAGLCFRTGRASGMGTYTTGFSPSTLGQLLSNSGDFTLEIWFRSSNRSLVGSDTLGLIWAIAGWQLNPALILPADSSTACNSLEYFGQRQPGLVASSYNIEYLRASGGTGGSGCLTTPFAPSTPATYNDLHQLVVVANHLSPSAYISTYLDNILVATSSLQPKTWVAPTQLYLGPSYLNTRWNGDIHLVAFYGQALTTAQLTQNFNSLLPDNPTVAFNSTNNRQQGTSVLSIFNITLYNFNVNVLNCSLTLGITVLSLPKYGHLIVQIAGSSPVAYNAIGLVPFNIPNLQQTPIAYIPNYAHDFGFGFDMISYVGYNSADIQPPAAPIVAYGIVNILPLDQPPIPINQTLSPFAMQPISFTFTGINPNNVPGKSILPQTITTAYIVSLPHNGSICAPTGVPGASCLILKRSNLPWKVTLTTNPPSAAGPNVTYTSVAPKISESGLNPVFVDFFTFMLSNGELNSSSAAPTAAASSSGGMGVGTITFDVQNPIIPQPTLLVTQQVRTQQSTRVILQATDINNNNPGANAFISFKITSLPTAGILQYEASPATGLQPVTNVSSLPIFSSTTALALFYLPNELTAGFNADSFGFLIINSTNGFVSGPQIHYFFVNDPGLFIYLNATQTALTTIPTFVTITYINGAQNEPVPVQSQIIPGLTTYQYPIQFNIQVLSDFAQISFAHPELWGNVTITKGSMQPIASAGPAIGFLCTRTVLNLLLSNITIVFTDDETETLTFSTTDVNQQSGITYTTSGKMTFIVTLPASLQPSTSTLISKDWLIVLYTAVALIAVALIIVCIYAICLGQSLNKTISTETKMQKKQDKTRKKDQKETKKLIKHNDKEIKWHESHHKG